MEEVARPNGFSFTWNDFQQNIVSSVIKLVQDSNFSDVTIACDGSHHIQAHKIVLAASSRVLGDLLKQCNQPNPLIIISGTQPSTLNSILDFIYYGEVRIEYEEVNNFIELAEELLIRGIAGTKVENDLQKTNYLSLETKHNQNKTYGRLVKESLFKSVNKSFQSIAN